MKKVILSTLSILCLFFFVSCDSNEKTEIDNTVDLQKLADNVQNKSDELTSEETDKLYRSLNEEQLEQFTEVLSSTDDAAYTYDVQFRKDVLNKSKELFGKPFNHLSVEEQEEVFDNVETGTLLFANEGTVEVEEDLTQLEVGAVNDREDAPNWCVSYEFPLTLNHTWSPNTDWAFWTFVERIENGVPQGDCDLRFVYYHTLNALKAAENSVGLRRAAKYSGWQTWHFVGLGRMNFWYGHNSAYWPKRLGKK